ncbi:6-phospho-beta-galactosidase [bioreactor metagenome]|uniref:6-phospho-beta-galactosidase n=1 Tax=bioreactor metagenome TaxID=1076179 RepID=A0A645FG69_9ZZZZ
MDILLQVNVAGEETKFGIEATEVDKYIRIISQMNHICLKGLMTIAPFAENPEEIRPVFKKLYQIYIDIKNKRLDNVTMDYLSMGMSNDFEVAIEEGANCVGYHMWTCMDNWSWTNAYKNRYGFISVDLDKEGARTIKKSGHWFKQVADDHGFD